MAKKRYGILGWPVTHSLSPKMQNTAFKALQIEASYELIPVEPKNLNSKIARLKEERFHGWNVTVPHKQTIIDSLDSVEEAAKFSGSVNTVINVGGKLKGFSTDGHGLEMSIRRSFGIEISGGTFLFWGTGGAATAASFHFALNGAKAIYLINRTLDKASYLESRLKEANPKLITQVICSNNFELLNQSIEDADVVIQSTSIGLKKTDPISIPATLLVSSTRIVDMIYWKTPLLERAEKNGCHGVDGRDMLLYQGAKSFEIWTGINAPIEDMRKALNQAIHESMVAN